jgi:ABC-type lipoprotein release transport system permease subunit
MPLPLAYNVRNVRIRWRLTALAVSGIALVVAVFGILMAMSEGFLTALRSTGRPDNAIVVHRGTASEMTSEVPLDQRRMILDDERVARGPGGEPLASWESVTVIALPKRSDGRRTNVTLRGVPPSAFEVRGGIQVTAGRRFTPGLDEVIIGRRIMERVRGLALGGTLTHRRKEFRIVGVFASEGAGFESEVWGDFDTLNSLLRRGARSNSLVVRMKDPAAIPAFDRWIRSHPGVQLQALEERRYYENQAGYVSTALKALAALVAVVMGTGAVFGAMNTMYAIVAARGREIGTLRALGFSRRAILLSFVVESAVLAAIGGALGCLLAFTVHGYSTGASNLQTFSEVAYAFRITPAIVASALVFALVMGVAGGLLPSVRAARLPIAAAVREG